MSKPPDMPRTDHVLRERARELARPPAPPQMQATLDVLEFGLADERYALPAADAREVHPLRDLAPIPCTPDFLAGLVNIRGRIVPVVDVKRFLGLAQRGISDLHHVVLVGTAEIEVGLLAATIEGVRAVDVEALQPSVARNADDATHIRGIACDGLIVLDIQSILADERLIVDEEA